ncbi:MAG: flavin-containing monooxygenase [Actinomycetales bacterium]
MSVLVVGAGPAGLATARALQANGVDYLQVERHAGVGGLWDIDNPGSPIYESAHFISIRTLSAFSGYPMPQDYPDYPSRRQVLAYLQGFAERYELPKRIRFNTAVQAIKQHPDGSWSATFTDGSQEHFSAVACATGMLWEPLTPQYPGHFDGAIRHSVTYRNADDLRGKRVLVIGAGNSGCDIACDIGRVADQTYVSVRRGYWFIPKHVFGIPSDVFAESGPHLPVRLQQRLFGWLLRVLNGDVTRLGLPKPDHRLFETHPILNTEILQRLQHGDVIAKPDVARLDGAQVQFTDGSSVPIDVIITATGYRHTIPYAQDYVGDEQFPDALYLSTFSRQFHNLFVMGFIETNSAAFGLFDLSAQLVAGYLRAQQDDPSAAAAFDARLASDQPDLSGGIRFVHSPRHTGYVDSTALKKAYQQALGRTGWSLPASADQLLAVS